MTEEILPAFESEYIAVVFVADSNYISQTAVMIQSIISNASSCKNYDIVVFFSELRDLEKENVSALIEGFSNFSIRYFDVSEYIKKTDFFTEAVYTNTQYKAEVYYRLLIPVIMRNYKKVVYLDGDMVALHDIYGLLHVDMNGKSIAATRDYCGIAACYDSNSDRLTYRKEKLLLVDMYSYFISCLIIFDVDRINSNYDCSTFLQIASSNTWKQHDQDVLNIIFQNDCEIIDGKWAFLEEYEYTSKFLPPSLYKELCVASADPYIVHFAGSNKAWLNKKSKFNVLFWINASKTRYFDVFNGLIDDDPLYRFTIYCNYLKKKFQYYYTYSSVYLLSQPQYIGELSRLKICIEKIDIDDKI